MRSAGSRICTCCCCWIPKDIRSACHSGQTTSKSHKRMCYGSRRVTKHGVAAGPSYADHKCCSLSFFRFTIQATSREPGVPPKQDYDCFGIRSQRSRHKRSFAVLSIHGLLSLVRTCRADLPQDPILNIRYGLQLTPTRSRRRRTALCKNSRHQKQVGPQVNVEILGQPL